MYDALRHRSILRHQVTLAALLLVRLLVGCLSALVELLGGSDLGSANFVVVLDLADVFVARRVERQARLRLLQ